MMSNTRTLVTTTATKPKEKNANEGFTVHKGISIIKSFVDEIGVLEIQDACIDEDPITNKQKAVLKICLVEHDWLFVCTIDNEWIDLKACFDPPNQLKPEFIYKCINSWNENRRFTRLTIDSEKDLWLRGDFPISHGNIKFLKESFRDIICAFIAAMSEYQAYLVSEAGTYAKVADIEINKFTSILECDESHTSEKCVLCFDKFEVGDKCIKLPCNHFFHRQEVEKYLYETPNCPLCRRSILSETTESVTTFNESDDL